MSWHDPLSKKYVQRATNKYQAKRTKCMKGHWHNSGAESALCYQLHQREQIGEHSNIRVEQSVYLSAARVRYVADFVVFDHKLQDDVWYEFKGKEMARWPTIKKLWRAYGPGKLRIYKGSATRMSMVEEINPKPIKEEE